MIPAQLEQAIEYVAKSSFSQPEFEAVKVAIFNYAEAEARKAIPYGLRTIARLLRWIYKKLKGDVKIMSGIATITVNDGTNVLEGATVSYVVNNVTCEATTDSTGVATVEGLDAGSYDFTATLSGYTSASVTLAITDDTTTAGTISLTKETTEGESTVSDITDAAKTAAEAAAVSSLVSTSTETTTTIADTINSKIKELTAEISTTSSPWVKVRNTVEIAALAGALAGIVAGLKSGLEELKDKIS